MSAQVEPPPVKKQKCIDGLSVAEESEDVDEEDFDVYGIRNTVFEDTDCAES